MAAGVGHVGPLPRLRCMQAHVRPEVQPSDRQVKASLACVHPEQPAVAEKLWGSTAMGVTSPPPATKRAAGHPGPHSEGESEDRSQLLSFRPTQLRQAFGKGAPSCLEGSASRTPVGSAATPRRSRQVRQPARPRAAGCCWGNWASFQGGPPALFHKARGQGAGARGAQARTLPDGSQGPPSPDCSLQARCHTGKSVLHLTCRTPLYQTRRWSPED